MARSVLVCVLLAAVAACGGEPERPGPGPAAPPATPDPDPGVVRDYEKAPVPAPVPFASSKIRAEAAKDGVFEGLPPAGDLGALLSAFAGVKAAAAVSVGRTAGGPAGPSVEPSREELRFAELTDRLKAALAAASPGDAREAWKATGLGAEALEGFTLLTTTAKVFGTGYVETVEAHTVPVPAPR